MNPAEFAEMLDLYGANLAVWPEPQRSAAQALLDLGPGEAWKHYRAAQFVEQLLNEPVPAVDRALLDRVLAISAYQPPEPKFDVLALFTAWQRGLVGATVFASLAAGLFTGWNNMQSYQPYADNDVFDAADIPGLSFGVGEWGGDL